MFNIKCIVISLRGEVWAHLTSLTQPYFIEVSVSCEESDWSSGCLLEVSILSLSTTFLLDFRTVPTE